MDILSSKSREALRALHEKESELIAGNLDAASFKPFGAPLGIYEQKDGAFMFRIRIPGGHLETAKLSAVAEIARAAGAKSVHFTTRQDVQLHGVAPGKFHSTGEALLKAGVTVRGGGGNTVRNITASPLSGLRPDSVFDVTPVAVELSNHLLKIDKLFELPRKYKIAFSCSAADDAGAAWHDLGFIAVKTPEGHLGFKVFGGGGLGREPRAGVKLFDFIRPQEVFKCAVAMGDLFSENGDRKDRNAARIRFIAKRLGEDAFRKLFMEYWETTSADDAPHLTIEEKPRGLPEGATTHPLKLPFRDGALTLDQLELIAQLAESRKLPFIRLSQDQAAWLPAVKAKETSQVLAELGLLEESANVFKPVACVGASVCKIGALDSRAAAAKVSEALAKLDAPQEALLSFVKSLRISGCANSCSGHLVAPLGLQGSGKAGSGRFKILVGGSCGEGGAKIASASSNWSVPEEKAGEFAAALAKAFVDSKAPSFPEWIEANAESVLAPWKGA